LGAKILGDRLYGCDRGENRLHLHARELSFLHPHLGTGLRLKLETPF
jgi:tRNA pseudouridine32 synthase/23S rRNA pseudouridine746 synthase